MTRPPFAYPYPSAGHLLLVIERGKHDLYMRQFRRAIDFEANGGAMGK